VLRSRPMSDAVSRAVAGPTSRLPRPARTAAPAVPGAVRPVPPGPPPRPGVPTNGPSVGQPPIQAGQALPAAALAVAMTRDSVRLTDVTKTYSNGKSALLNVDLVIPSGDFVFLVGPSGAGKSTLIKLLVRDERASSGSVEVVGHDLGRMRRKDVPLLRRKIGIVFQDFRLLPRKTVYENVAFALEVTGTPRSLVEPAVERALALVGLTEQARQRPDQLSGGEMQRTAIARAMVHDPRLIIADEPTGNLDPLISWEIIQLLLRINEMGTTVMMATHDAEVVTALQRRVVALEDGRIVRDEVGGYHREY